MWGHAARKDAEYAHSRLSSRRLTEAPPRCRGSSLTAWESGGRSALKPVIADRDLSTSISKDLLIDSVSQGARIRVKYMGAPVVDAGSEETERDIGWQHVKVRQDISLDADVLGKKSGDVGFRAKRG